MSLFFVFSLVSGQVFLVGWVGLGYRLGTLLFINGKEDLFCLNLLNLCSMIVWMGILAIVDFWEGLQSAQIIYFDLQLFLFLELFLVLNYNFPM